MNEFLRKYSKIAIILLALLVGIPCSLKRDIKAFIGIENQQGTNSNVNKVSCASVCSVFSKQEIEQNQKVFRKKQKALIAAHFDFVLAEHLPVLDDFSRLKEKIPSHILYQVFLI